jgi:PAS domain S-box-containing protein
MYHNHLERQIKKHLGNGSLTDEKIKQLLQAVSNSYAAYERDRELNEHSFFINEQEYQQVNNKLKQLNANLERIVNERTKDLEDIAQFPIENPNPILRISESGEILFKNPAAHELKELIWQNKKYSISNFFISIAPTLKISGSFDLIVKNEAYIFSYKKIKGKDYYNFYGANVTEKIKLQKEAEENAKRFRDFLESTTDIYYIVYNRNKNRNLITNQWKKVFGFDAVESQDLFSDKSKCVISELPKNHYSQIKKLKIGEEKSFLYQVLNSKTRQKYWLSETINKQYDSELKDYVVRGRISDVTTEQIRVMQIAESEERFRNFMDLTPVMVWVANEKNIITYSNKASKDFLGYALENLRDYKQYATLVHPDDRKIAIDQWQKNIRRKKEIISEYRLKSSKGKYHNILEKAIPRFYKDGSFAGYIGAYFDLTKEKLAQQNLSIENQKLELLTQHSPDIILLTDENGLLEFVSPTAQRILGYEPKSMLNKHINSYICKECLEYLNTFSWLKRVSKNEKKLEYRMRKKDGSLIWIESSIVKINNGKLGSNILMHNRDIDSIKKAEFHLRENEQKFRGIFENMNLGVMEVDLKDNVQWINKSFEKLAGYKLNQIKGKNAYEVFLKNNAEKKIMNEVVNQRKQKVDSIYEIKMKNKSGDLMDVVISGSPIVDIHGNVRGSVGIHWDVTQIRKMEQMIEDEKSMRQKEVMQATLNAEEQQRQLLGNELHDGVGHILTYTSLFLQMASSSENISRELFKNAQIKVEEALNEVRRISRNLIPPALQDLGFRDAIIELFNQYAQFEKIIFNIDCSTNAVKGIEFNAQRNIYRIVQELINNTVKHSKADKVNVVFRRTVNRLFIEYFDNGVGFDTKKVKRGVGINSIENRAYFYGGKTDIKSSKNRGTHYIFELPLNNITSKSEKKSVLIKS